jgi:hypothetical protein
MELASPVDFSFTEDRVIDDDYDFSWYSFIEAELAGREDLLPTIFLEIHDW